LFLRKIAFLLDREFAWFVFLSVIIFLVIAKVWVVGKILSRWVLVFVIRQEGWRSWVCA
jgi:hypothetical protein